MTIGLSDLMGIAPQVANMVGKGRDSKGMLNVISKLPELWSEYKKYPQTIDGLKKILADYNVSKEHANKAMSILSTKYPELHKLVEDKLPGSLNTIVSALGNDTNNVGKDTNITSEGYQQSDRLKRLLEASKRK